MTDEVRTRICLQARNDQWREAQEVFRVLNAELNPEGALGPVAIWRSLAPDDFTSFSQSLEGDVSAAVREHFASRGNPFDATVEVWINGIPTDD